MTQNLTFLDGENFYHADFPSPGDCILAIELPRRESIVVEARVEDMNFVAVYAPSIKSESYLLSLSLPEELEVRVRSYVNPLKAKILVDA